MCPIERSFPAEESRSIEVELDENLNSEDEDDECSVDLTEITEENWNIVWSGANTKYFCSSRFVSNVFDRDS